MRELNLLDVLLVLGEVLGRRLLERRQRPLEPEYS